jgi:hypothetical protein
VFDVPPAFFEPKTGDELEVWEGAMPTCPSSRVSSSAGVTRVAERRGSAAGRS